jgi:hypothetical protein
LCPSGVTGRRDDSPPGVTARYPTHGRNGDELALAEGHFAAGAIRVSAPPRECYNVRSFGLSYRIMGPLGFESVTFWLNQWHHGTEGALEELTRLVYEDLRRLAAHYLQDEHSAPTLQATALVHELYLRISIFQSKNDHEIG